MNKTLRSTFYAPCLRTVHPLASFLLCPREVCLGNISRCLAIVAGLHRAIRGHICGPAEADKRGTFTDLQASPSAFDGSHSVAASLGSRAVL